MKLSFLLTYLGSWGVSFVLNEVVRNAYKFPRISVAVFFFGSHRVLQGDFQPHKFKFYLDNRIHKFSYLFTDIVVTNSEMVDLTTTFSNEFWYDWNFKFLVVPMKYVHNYLCWPNLNRESYSGGKWVVFGLNLILWGVDSCYHHDWCCIYGISWFSWKQL